MMNISGDLNDLTLFYFITREDINAIFEGYPPLKFRMIQSAFQSLTVESNSTKRKVELKVPEEEEKKQPAKKKTKKFGE